jgi:uncharacterized protein with von Willebrand factor type A (vWA) domain
MVKYRFKRIETVEDLLEAIGRRDIPSTKVILRKPGEDGSDVEIDFGEYTLSATDEAKLLDLMKSMGMKLKEKRA